MASGQQQEVDLGRLSLRPVVVVVARRPGILFHTDLQKETLTLREFQFNNEEDSWPVGSLGGNHVTLIQDQVSKK